MTSPGQPNPASNLIRRRIRRLWRVGFLILLAMFLAAEAVNMPLAIWCARLDIHGAYGVSHQVRSGIAEGTRWPTATPHAQPWPTPTSWDDGRLRFGWWRADVRASKADGNGFAAMVDLFGWPLPCFEMVQFWWPQNDPAWSLTSRQSSFIRLRWSGVLLNPLLPALAAWVLLVLPILLVRWTRWRTRLALGHCPDCAYDLRGDFLSGCPECGWNRPAQPFIPAPTAPSR